MGDSTLSAGLAPCSSKHLAAPRHRFEAAMCRAEPWLKSLQVEFTTGKWAGEGRVRVCDCLPHLHGASPLPAQGSQSLNILPNLPFCHIYDPITTYPPPTQPTQPAIPRPCMSIYPLFPV